MIDPFFLSDYFIMTVEHLFGNVGVLRCHGNDFFIVKWNTQFFRQTEPHFTTAASKLTAYGNDSAHNCCLLSGINAVFPS